MKHKAKITILLLALFFITQLIGLGVTKHYSSSTLPYGLEPPKDINPQQSLYSIIFSIAFAVILILILMKFRAETFLRLWFFIVVVLAVAITLNAALSILKYSALISIILALPLAFLKIFRRNIFVHNLTELAIYPGVASIFIPILNVWTVVVLLIIISFYDIYAVWHAGFMQKMAKYQIQKLKFFSGFFVPYLGKKEKEMIEKSRNSKNLKLKEKKVKVNVAILGGGDVVFPIILAGVVLAQFGLFSALIISIGATIALGLLFFYSQKGKFYPAMPFITAGCFLALGLVYLLSFLGLL